jgi:hypothetical protein
MHKELIKINIHFGATLDTFAKLESTTAVFMEKWDKKSSSYTKICKQH